ncbi:MAG: metallophosphoesterase [Deltaproteobacteria bacterium]|nr:metallophosphoesterase [Deltaproteobacteria bacterium]
MRLKLSIAVAVLVLIACKAEAPANGPPDAAACPECPTCSDPGPLRILVLGDRTGRPDDALFRAALEEAALLKPDLVLCVGDLIEGYQPDEKLDEAAAEWDHVLGIIRRFLGDVPLYSTAGNHDVWSDKSAALFEERLGHGVNFAFDAGGARIILFDSSRVKREADLSDDALNWLVRELARSSNHTARIVVTHIPLFAISPGGRYGSPLHDVLIAGGADWVLTGHWHHAMSDDRDEIRYRMIGTTGARPHMPGHPESGNFQQFGFLTIDRGVVELSLVPMGSLLPDDAFPYELNQLEWKIENLAVTIEGFNIDTLHPRRTGVFHAVITNVTDDQMNSEVSFATDLSPWRIRPKSRALSLSPGESKRLRFTFSLSPRKPLFPGPRLSLPFPWPEDRKYLLDREIRPNMNSRSPEPPGRNSRKNQSQVIRP